MEGMRRKKKKYEITFLCVIAEAGARLQYDVSALNI